MFNPDLRGVLKNHLSRYSLVTATAKRAREIAETAEENKEIMTCPVLTANNDRAKRFKSSLVPECYSPNCLYISFSSLLHSHACSKWFSLLPGIVKSRKSMKIQV